MFKRSIQFILCLTGLFFAVTCMAGNAAIVKQLFHSPNDPTAGNPRGEVTVVEFFDYQCSHCVEMAPVISAILKSNPNVRFIFKEFPIFGEASRYAALASLAANKQGKYLDFNHTLFSAERPLTKKSILEAAQKAGLNMKKLQADMDNQSIINQLNQNMKLAQDLKLNGTPAFIFVKTEDDSNLNIMLGSMSLNDMQSVINKTNG